MAMTIRQAKIVGSVERKEETYLIQVQTHRSQNKEPLNSIRFRRRDQLFENIWLESPP